MKRGDGLHSAGCHHHHHHHRSNSVPAGKDHACHTDGKVPRHGGTMILPMALPAVILCPAKHSRTLVVPPPYWVIMWREEDHYSALSFSFLFFRLIVSPLEDEKLKKLSLGCCLLLLLPITFFVVIVLTCHQLFGKDPHAFPRNLIIQLFCFLFVILPSSFMSSLVMG